MNVLKILIIAVSLMISLLVTNCQKEEDEKDELASDYAGYQIVPNTVCKMDAGPFSSTIDNPYFPLPVNRKIVIEGNDEGIIFRVEFTVLDETETIGDVTTQVVQEEESENGEIVEISRNFFAQASDGTVCYFGEEVDMYTDGTVTAHDGAWRADEPDNEPGIFMPANPAVGTKFQQEIAPGIAEDWSAVTRLGDSVATDFGTYSNTLRMFDWNQLDVDEDGEISGDVKYYAHSIGMISDEVAFLVEYQE